MDQQGFLVLCHNHDDDDEWYKDLTITLQSNANGMLPMWNDGSDTEWWNYDTVYTATYNYKLNRLVALVVVAAMVSVQLIFLITSHLSFFVSAHVRSFVSSSHPTTIFRQNSLALWEKGLIKLEGTELD